jgi:hypothetical protein
VTDEDRPEPVDPAARQDGTVSTETDDAAPEPVATAEDSPATAGRADDEPGSATPTGPSATPRLFTAMLVGGVVLFLGVLGGVGLATGVDDLTGVDELLGDEPAPADPRAVVDFDYNRAAGTVTVAHAAGDRFATANTGTLWVYVDDRRTRWSLPVEEGDEITVEAEPGQSVDVVRRGPDGEVTVVDGVTLPDDR